MVILQALINTLQKGTILEVRVGLHWTAVVAEINGQRQCGLAATLFEHYQPAAVHEHKPDVPLAGQLESLPGDELARLVFSDQPVLSSVGMAAINALLPPHPHQVSESNAEEIIASHGAGKRVVLVGHFPFVPRLRSRVGELVVLELNPRPGDTPADQAPLVLPEAQVVAITSMTLVNGTLPGLLALCPKDAFVMLLGPSTPLTPLMFDYGVHLLSGSVVTSIDDVVRAASQGANFRQLHQAGVRLVNLQR